MNKDILGIPGHRDKRDSWGPLAYLDREAKGEGEETLEQREHKVQTVHKERRENEGHRETEVGPGKTDSRAQREAKDYRGRGVLQDQQGALEKMAPWEILEILDLGESLGPLDQRVTKEEQDSAILDREDPPETEVIQVDEDPGGAEANVVPKENLEIKDPKESLGNQVSQVNQEREDPEGTLDLMGTQDLRVILGSLTVMS